MRHVTQSMPLLLSNKLILSSVLHFHCAQRRSIPFICGMISSAHNHRRQQFSQIYGGASKPAKCWPLPPPPLAHHRIPNGNNFASKLFHVCVVVVYALRYTYVRARRTCWVSCRVVGVANAHTKYISFFFSSFYCEFLVGKFNVYT